MTRRIVLAVATLLAAAGVVVVSGVIPINASSGHWAVTYSLLDFIKQRSVATHSIGIDVPLLNDPAMVLTGAAHYEQGCRSCHGSPEAGPPPLSQRMTPSPPDLRQQVDRWDAAELFYIVKHGIKFTGMPGWTARGRDDEVWAVVAFLRTLTRTDATTYGRLVFDSLPRRENARSAQHLSATPAGVARFIEESCARCHGVDGAGRTGSSFPRLAGQRHEYLAGAVRAYAAGTRHSGIMTPIAASLGDDLVASIARHYASQLAPAKGGDRSDNVAAVARGAIIAGAGIPARQVPPCAECHGPDRGDRNPAYPILVGQPAAYLSQQLRLFATGQRGGSNYAHIMQPVASQLTPAHIADVVAYYASLSVATRP